jgi:acetyl-CoA acetyltransferase
MTWCGVARHTQVANVSLNDVDLVEINEAFAAQFLACEKELGLDRNKANLCGAWACLAPT